MKTINTNPFDWFNFTAQNCNSNALIQFVLKADNSLNFDFLKRALSCCIVSDPILGCRFLVKDDMPQWIESEQDISQLCKIIKCENLDNDIFNCLSERIDASEECPIKLYMIEDHESNYLIIKTHHALCDAAGSLQFVRLLADMYANIEKNPNFQPESKQPCRGTESFYRHFNVTNKASNFNPSLLSEMKSTWGAPFDDVTTNQTFAYKTIRFSEPELMHVIQFAQKNDSSLNAVLTAAYHRTLCNLLKPNESNKEIQFSANLRNYSDEDNNTICNFSNLFNIQLPTKGDFTQLVKETKKAIDTTIAPEKILQCVLACKLMSTDFKTLDSYYKADWNNIKHNGLCTPIISNIGRLDKSPIRFGSCEIVDMFLVSPAFVSPSFMISVGTYRNIMTLCIAYQKPSIDDTFITSVLEMMKSILTTI